MDFIITSYKFCRQGHQLLGENEDCKVIEDKNVGSKCSVNMISMLTCIPSTGCSSAAVGLLYVGAGQHHRGKMRKNVSLV